MPVKGLAPASRATDRPLPAARVEGWEALSGRTAEPQRRFTVAVASDRAILNEGKS